MIKHYVWLFPFIFFLGGYVITRHYLYIPYLKVPSVVGQQLTDACTSLSSLNLNVRILEIKQDEELPEGTVINQLPSPHQLIKPRQTIFLTISKHPPHVATPNLLGQAIAQLEALSNQKVKIKYHLVPSEEPGKLCFGQTPAPGAPLDGKIITAYVSGDRNRLVVWPNFVGQQIEHVIDFLAPYQLEPHIEKQTNQRIIREQHPLAGSIIDLNQKPYIQFHT